MATDKEASDAGFSMPQGTWPISGGDDAIRQNARKALDLFNSAKFVHQFQGVGGDLNDLLDPGWHGYWSDWANRPSNTSGNVLVIPPPAGTGGAITQIAYPYGNAVAIFARYRGNSGAFSRWKQLDVGAVEPAGPTTIGVMSPSSLKRVPLILTAATATGESTATGGSVRFPLRFGAPITRWRVHVRNYNYASGKTFTSGGRTSAVWFGRGKGPAYTDNPALVAAPLDIPTDGSDAVTEWISTPIEPNTDYLISIGWLTADATPKVQTAGGGWVAPRSADVNSKSGTEFTSTFWMPFDWWIEAETAATTPTIAAYGDSITTGTGTDQIVNTSWLSQLARKFGALPIHYSYPGSGMSVWLSADDQKWHRWEDLPPADSVIHFMGQNDLGSASSAAVMKQRFETTLPLIRQHISPNVYVATITPHAAKTDAQDAIRREHATYLRSLPLGVRDVFDFAAAVSSDDIALKPEYRGGPAGTDELHPNAAGGLAMANAVIRPIIYSDPSSYDSGLRSLNSLVLNRESGDLTIERIGNLVTISAYNLKLTTSAGGTLLSEALPHGWRPSASLAGMSQGLSSRLQVSYAGNVQAYNWTAGTGIFGTITYATRGEVTTLPGSPA